MYKLLLCWRYLRTRYIALASIVSVTLGVATMIVVNSVMQGFTSEMQNRIHGILSDVVIETYSLDGMPDTPAHVAQIRKAAGDDIEAMTPTVVVPAMLDYQYGGMPIVRPVQLIGIDETDAEQRERLRQVLAAPGNRRAMSFDLRNGGYDVRDHQAGPDAPERKQMGRGRLGIPPLGGAVQRPRGTKRQTATIAGCRADCAAVAGRLADCSSDCRSFRRPMRRTSAPRRAPASIAAKQQYHRHRFGHRPGQLPHPRGRGPFRPSPATT